MAFNIYPFYKISNELFRPWIPVTIINPANNKFIKVFALLIQVQIIVYFQNL